MDGCCGESGEGFNHQRSAGFGEEIEEFNRGLIGAYFEGLLEKDGAGVEAFFQQHGGVAGDGVAHGYGPLDGRCATVPGQQRAVEIDTAEARESEHPRGDDAAICDDDDGVGRDGFKLGAELDVGADFFGLGDGETCDEGGLLHWG